MRQARYYLRQLVTEVNLNNEGLDKDTMMDSNDFIPRQLFVYEYQPYHGFLFFTAALLFLLFWYAMYNYYYGLPMYGTTTTTMVKSNLTMVPQGNFQATTGFVRTPPPPPPQSQQQSMSTTSPPVSSTTNQWARDKYDDAFPISHPGNKARDAPFELTRRALTVPASDVTRASTIPLGIPVSARGSILPNGGH